MMTDLSPRRSHWRAVEEELDQWLKRGIVATFWIRDDDAVALTRPFERLISVANEFRVEVALAVIPAKLTDPLSEVLLSGAVPCFPMCHGWRHVNYASPLRPSEFGPQRPLAVVIDDAKCAFEEFSRRFGGKAVIFVPPFGQVAVEIVGELPKLGFSGVSIAPSLAEARYSRVCSRLKYARPVLHHVKPRALHYDVHVDPFDWVRNRARSENSIAREIVGYLRARRMGFVNPSSPIGFLMHHLKFDEDTWRISSELLRILVNHPATSWPAVRTIVNDTPKQEIVARTTPQSEVQVNRAIGLRL
jgi:hypothetical protein